MNLLNPVRSPTLILDVGADQGIDGLRLAQANPQLHVIASEPTR